METFRWYCEDCWNDLNESIPLDINGTCHGCGRCYGKIRDKVPSRGRSALYGAVMSGNAYRAQREGVFMKLWLISQYVNAGYDTYDSAVVAAETEEEARLI